MGAIQRDNQGRFLKGASANPSGRPHTNIAKFREELANCVDFKKLAKKLYTLAMDGDVAAMKLLLQYLVGNPDTIVADVDNQIVVNVLQGSRWRDVTSDDD